MASQKNYHERKALGICTECGESPRCEETLLCATCRLDMAAKQRLWHNEHRELDNINMKKRYATLRKQVFDALDNKCNCCGETEPDFLSLDHEGGWGKHERANLVRSGHSSSNSNIFRRVLKNITGYQLLCFNCHMSISFRGSCPHKR